MSEYQRPPGDPVSRVARVTAQRLAVDHGSELSAQVEKALYARRGGQPPTRFVDPVSLGSLIVSAAALSWTVYKDLCRKLPKPTHTAVALQVRIELPLDDFVSPAEREHVIDIVAEEIAKEGEGFRMNGND
jgi:hypothetical protein